MFLIDATGTLVFYNEAAELLIGRPFAELGEIPALEFGEVKVGAPPPPLPSHPEYLHQGVRPPPPQTPTRLDHPPDESLSPTSSPQPPPPASWQDHNTTVDKVGWSTPHDAAINDLSAVLLNIAAAALLLVADDVDADMIVAGRRGPGGSERRLLGAPPTQVAPHPIRPFVFFPSG